MLLSCMQACLVYRAVLSAAWLTQVGALQLGNAGGGQFDPRAVVVRLCLLSCICCVPLVCLHVDKQGVAVAPGNIPCHIIPCPLPVSG
jgi:hypothetical protein